MFEYMKTIISLHLSATLDADLRRGKTEVDPPTGAAGDFRRLLTTYGLKPEPLFSGNREAALECIWHVASPHDEAAEIIEKLLRVPGVEGAYIKPPEGLPSSP